MDGSDEVCPLHEPPRKQARTVRHTGIIDDSDTDERDAVNQTGPENEDGEDVFKFVGQAVYTIKQESLFRLHESLCSLRCECMSHGTQVAGTAVYTATRTGRAEKKVLLVWVFRTRGSPPIEPRKTITIADARSLEEQHLAVILIPCASRSNGEVTPRTYKHTACGVARLKGAVQECVKKKHSVGMKAGFTRALKTARDMCSEKSRQVSLKSARHDELVFQEVAQPQGQDKGENEGAGQIKVHQLRTQLTHVVQKVVAPLWLEEGLLDASTSIADDEDESALRSKPSRKSRGQLKEERAMRASVLPQLDSSLFKAAPGRDIGRSRKHPSDTGQAFDYFSCPTKRDEVSEARSIWTNAGFQEHFELFHPPKQDKPMMYKQCQKCKAMLLVKDSHEDCSVEQNPHSLNAATAAEVAGSASLEAGQAPCPPLPSDELDAHDGQISDNPDLPRTLKTPAVDAEHSNGGVILQGVDGSHLTPQRLRPPPHIPTAVPSEEFVGFSPDKLVGNAARLLTVPVAPVDRRAPTAADLEDKDDDFDWDIAERTCEPQAARPRQTEPHMVGQLVSVEQLVISDAHGLEDPASWGLRCVHPTESDKPCKIQRCGQRTIVVQGIGSVVLLHVARLVCRNSDHENKTFIVTNPVIFEQLLGTGLRFSHHLVIVSRQTVLLRAAYKFVISEMKRELDLSRAASVWIEHRINTLSEWVQTYTVIAQDAQKAAGLPEELPLQAWSELIAFAHSIAPGQETVPVSEVRSTLKALVDCDKQSPACKAYTQQLLLAVEMFGGVTGRSSISHKVVRAVFLRSGVFDLPYLVHTRVGRVCNEGCTGRG